MMGKKYQTIFHYYITFNQTTSYTLVMIVNNWKLTLLWNDCFKYLAEQALSGTKDVFRSLYLVYSVLKQTCVKLEAVLQTQFISLEQFESNLLAYPAIKGLAPTSFRAVNGAFLDWKIISKVIVITIKISKYAVLKASNICSISCSKLKLKFENWKCFM